MPELTANELLQGLKTGDRKVIHRIYNDVFPKVKSYLMKNGAGKDDVHDVFHDALETMLVKVDKIQSSFDGMLMQMCKYKWIDKTRKVKRDRVRNDDAARLINKPEEADEYIIKSEQAYMRYTMMEKTFLQLSEKCRQLITMIRQEKKVKEMVVALDYPSANTLYRRKSACMERWASLIKSEQGNMK